MKFLVIPIIFKFQPYQIITDLFVKANRFFLPKIRSLKLDLYKSIYSFLLEFNHIM